MSNAFDLNRRREGTGDRRPPVGGEIVYRILSPDSWKLYGRQVLAIEKSLFHPWMVQEHAELRDVFVNPKAIFITALEADVVAGFVCGEDLWHYVEPHDPEFDSGIEEAGTIYVETIDVNPAKQGMGIGTGLLRAFVAEARLRGYKHVAGHWRQGASLGLIMKFGGKVRMVEENYLGTGETYSYVVLDL